MDAAVPTPAAPTVLPLPATVVTAQGADTAVDVGEGVGVGVEEGEGFMVEVGLLEEDSVGERLPVDPGLMVAVALELKTVGHTTRRMR